MYRLLETMRFEPYVVCEFNPHSLPGLRICHPTDTEADSFDLIVYHHSQYWLGGEAFLKAASCPVIFRYHNITPAHFFERYTKLYSETCRLGREQTERLITVPGRHFWLTDSEYNLNELISEGADPAAVGVMPPFTRAEALLKEGGQSMNGSGRIDLLFVGRFAPNKGHKHLVRIVEAFSREHSEKVLLRIVGSIDPALDCYYREIVKEIMDFGLQNQVEIWPQCSDSDLKAIFLASHVYLCCSEHEGFCVPIVESQALGLPVVAASESAVGETAGESQLLADIPRTETDYSFYAAMVDKVTSDSCLRNQLISTGYRNVRTRFLNELVENAFAGAIYNVLRAP